MMYARCLGKLEAYNYRLGNYQYTELIKLFV